MFFVGHCANVRFLFSARATGVWSGGTGATCDSLSTDAPGRGAMNHLRGLDAPERGLRAGVQILAWL